MNENKYVGLCQFRILWEAANQTVSLDSPLTNLVTFA